MSAYVSGHCGVGAHDRCRALYAGVPCACSCEHRPPEPEPIPDPVVAHHCPTCTCEQEIR